MSLHRFVAPPPLVLAMHPAPARPSNPSDKNKDKPKDGEVKQAVDAKDKKEDRDPKDVDEQKAEAVPKEGVEKKMIDGPLPLSGGAAIPQTVKKLDDKLAGQVPDSPGSMVPEPPTPLPGAETPDTPIPEKAKGGEEGTKIAAQPTSVPPPTTVKANDDLPKQGETKPDESKSETDPLPEPEPVRLLCPAPPRPVRTRVDLNPAKPYPPIQTDPRGVYYHYAKESYAQWIDLAKDGWLADQWRERTEREALARLRGETETQRMREIDADKKRREKKVLPKEATAILADIWNACVEAHGEEVSTRKTVVTLLTVSQLHMDEFWSRYDWDLPDAKVHLMDVRKEEGTTSAEVDGVEVEWTKEGVEEVLSSVGVQCVYNTVVSLVSPPFPPPLTLLETALPLLVRTSRSVPASSPRLFHDPYRRLCPVQARGRTRQVRGPRCQSR
jgi:hypothetical protein